jgi:hypothetical protein
MVEAKLYAQNVMVQVKFGAIVVKAKERFTVMFVRVMGIQVMMKMVKRFLVGNVMALVN